jgi:hypothetical protein
MQDENLTRCRADGHTMPLDCPVSRIMNQINFYSLPRLRYFVIATEKKTRTNFVFVRVLSRNPANRVYTYVERDLF